MTMACSESRNIISTAEAKAKEIRAKGDAAAAEAYEVFNQNPELAAYLRKLDSLKKIMETKTTVVLDTNTAPFDILKENSYQLKSDK